MRTCAVQGSLSKMAFRSLGSMTCFLLAFFGGAVDWVSVILGNAALMALRVLPLDLVVLW